MEFRTAEMLKKREFKIRYFLIDILRFQNAFVKLARHAIFYVII
jgi:hypothetical protein